MNLWPILSASSPTHAETRSSSLLSFPFQRQPHSGENLLTRTGRRGQGEPRPAGVGSPQGVAGVVPVRKERAIHPDLQTARVQYCRGRLRRGKQKEAERSFCLPYETKPPRWCWSPLFLPSSPLLALSFFLIYVLLDVYGLYFF